MREIITTGCASWNLPLDSEALDRIESFTRLLLETNKVMNLTRVTELPDIARRHMLDCLFLLTCHDLEKGRIIDIGCGPGFPSMPLLCARPGLDITALDSTGKRIDFILDCCRQLELPITAIAARAEEQVHKPGFFQGFDTALSRAVAPMNLLAELCLPFVAIGGVFLAQKSTGPETAAELEQGKKAIHVLGGQIEECIPYHIDGLERQHQVIKISKVRDTPPQYPRRYAKMNAQPL